MTYVEEDPLFTVRRHGITHLHDLCVRMLISGQGICVRQLLL